MATLGKILPHLAAHLPASLALFDPSPQPWSPTQLWALVNAAVAQFADAGPAGPALLTDLALVDLGEAEQSHLLSRPTAMASRLCIVLGMAHGCLASGDVDAARTWLVRGFGGTSDEVSQISTEGLTELLRLVSSGDPTAADLIANLAAALFYLNQHAGYLAEIVDPVAESLIGTLLQMPPTDAACDGVPAALTWAAHRGRDDLSKPLTAWCRRANGRVRTIEQTIQLQFAVAITQTGPSRLAAMQALLAATPAHMPGLRLQIRLAGLDETRNPTAAELDAILALIDEDRLARADDDAESPGLLHERRLSMLGPLLSGLSRAGAAHEALRVLRHWIGAPDEDTSTDCLLLMHTSDGVRYVWSGGTWLTPASDDQALAAAVNAALGTALVSTVDTSSRVHTPATGRPDRSAGMYLAQTAVQTLGLSPAPSWISRLNETTLLVPVPGHRIPYQGLLSKHLGIAPPLWTSLRTPRRERFPHRIALIEGDTHLAAVEAALVTEVLDGGGFEVDHRRGPDVTVGSFTLLYTDPTYDVVWLTCHGHQPAYAPDQATLLLRDDEEVTTAGLLAAHMPSENRRLLVLNSCDGAATATAGGLRTRGLAAQAANPYQTVIGHQWIVDEGLAATFGVLFACALVDHRAVLPAWNMALTWLRLPWPDVEQILERHDCRDELTAQLAPATGSYGNNILDWAAPALYC